jgi:predicted Fe-Mo cluster-binding NifX family protein
VKIAVPVDGGRLTPHFGHAGEFVVIHVENKKIRNKEFLVPPPHEPGVLPQWLYELGVGVVIAGGLGHKAITLLKERGIEVITGAASLTPEVLVQQHLANTLVRGDNICDH